MNEEALQVDQQPDSFEQERALLVHELKEAQAMNKALMRQLKKAQESASEALRAHAKMVSTLTETMRANTELAFERDTWKNRAQRLWTETHQPPPDGDISNLLRIEYVTEAEARAIRKAIARIHHPDSGGDPERMKLWNAALDKIEFVP